MGLLAQITDKLHKALAHFEDALAFCRQGGCRPELAWTCHDYAEALIQRAGKYDSYKAISLLDEAYAISQKLGMIPLAERVIPLRERAQSTGRRDKEPPAPDYPGGLTQREVEVLCLVASGMSSAEIAAELVLSRRTVERHISNIYHKTNTRNRSETTAFTHGMVPSS